MKKLIFSSAFALACSIVNAQEQRPASPKDTTSKEEVYVVVQEMPVFSEGSFQSYLAKTITLPKDFKGVGTVYADFVIGKDGKVHSERIVRAIEGCNECSEQVLSAIRKSPAWTPGYQAGRPVSVRFTVPVRFRNDK